MDLEFMGYMGLFTKPNGKLHCVKLFEDEMQLPWYCLSSIAIGCNPKLMSGRATKFWGNRRTGLSKLTGKPWCSSLPDFQWGKSQRCNTAAMVIAHLSFPYHRGADPEEIARGIFLRVYGQDGGRSFLNTGPEN